MMWLIGSIVLLVAGSLIELKVLRDLKTGAALQGFGWPLIVGGLILLLVWRLRRPRPS